MAFIDGLFHRVRVLLAPESYRKEIEREIRFHLDLEAMQQRSAGLAASDAEGAARGKFGNVTYTHEEVRRMTLMRFVDRVRQDARYALRSLRQSPTFTIGVALTLGLGLGVNAAMFDFLDRVFVRPPAGVSNPGEVRRLFNDMASSGKRAAYEGLRYAQVRAMAQAADTSISLGIFTTSKDTATMASDANQMLVQRTFASATYFRVLGVKLAAGRMFDSTEDRIDMRAPVAIITYDLWQRMFNANPAAIGSVVRFGKTPIAIVGVTGKEFAGITLDRTDVWMPAGNYYDYTRPGDLPWYETYHSDFAVVTRIASAMAERRFRDVATRAYREVHIKGWAYDSTAFIRSGPIVSALGPMDRSQEISIALRLGGVSLIVLLIALANVSNLLLVRASKRSREIAVRRALGAGQGRLFGQFLTESILLSLASLVVSGVLAFWVGLSLRSLLVPKIAWPSSPLDIRSVSIALLTTITVGIAIGVAPALQAWRPELVAALRAGSARNGSGRSRITAFLVVTQAAFSVVLLVGAGLFVRSLANVRAVDVGYDVSQTLIIKPLTAANQTAKSLATLMPSVVERLASIPGVDAVASSSLGPMDGEAFGPFSLPGVETLPTVGGDKFPSFLDVSPAFFRATGIRVVAGRVFSEGDKSGVVVSDAMAKAYWPGESALGKCVILDDKTHACVSVIGVVSDVNRWKIIEPERSARYYVSTARMHEVVVLHAAGARTRDIAAQVGAEIRAIVPEVATVRVRSIADMLNPQLRPWRLGAILFTAMGVLALVVATIGVYSVVSYVVAQRTNEMGIRIALGAQVADITRLVVGDGMRTVAVGIGVGVLMSIALARLVASMLYGVSARDPLVIGAAALILAAIGMSASLIPALRAARVSPMEALRVD